MRIWLRLCFALGESFSPHCRTGAACHFGSLSNLGSIIDRECRAPCQLPSHFKSKRPATVFRRLPAPGSLPCMRRQIFSWSLWCSPRVGGFSLCSLRKDQRLRERLIARWRWRFGVTPGWSSGIERGSEPPSTGDAPRLVCLPPPLDAILAAGHAACRQAANRFWPPVMSRSIEESSRCNSLPPLFLWVRFS